MESESWKAALHGAAAFQAGMALLLVGEASRAVLPVFAWTAEPLLGYIDHDVVSDLVVAAGLAMCLSAALRDM